MDLAKIESKSLEEIEALKAALHEKEDAVRDDLRALEAIAARKRTMALAQAALKAAGVDGSVLLTPAHAVVGVTAADGSVS